MSQDFINSLMNYALDVNVQMSKLNSVRQVEINDMPVGSGFTSVTAARKSFKSFIVGIIPPDVTANFKAVDVVNSRMSLPSQSTARGQSVSSGVNIPPGATRGLYGSGPQELQPVRTRFTDKELGESISRDLKRRRFSDADVVRLTPLMVGNINAECGGGGGFYDCRNYNIANLHTGRPGEYVDPNDLSKGYKTPPIPPKGGKYVLGTDYTGSGEKPPHQAYPTYFQASSSLDEATSNFVSNVLQGWPGVASAQDVSSYNRALRPDLYSDVPGRVGNNARGQYYGAPPAIYERNMQAGAMRYVKNYGGTLVSTQGGIGYYTVQGAIAGPPEAKNGPPGAEIITSGNITDPETGDPLSSTGRNIRVTTDHLRYAVVQRQLDQLNRQILIAQQIPPLAMLVNPQEFTRSYEHQTDTPKTRRGHIVHMWLEKPITISCHGVTAGQYIIASDGSGGLTNRFRTQSLSYLNLASLVRIYKNNGYIFSGDVFGDLNSNIQMLTMCVYIYYDGHIYLGSFDDFQITDSADKPYNISYSYRFTVRYDIDVTAVTDNQIVGLG
jgi:hypothetical protein